MLVEVPDCLGGLGDFLRFLLRKRSICVLEVKRKPKWWTHNIRKIYFGFYAIVVNRCASVEPPYPPSASERFEAIPREHLPKKCFRYNGRPMGVLPLTCLVCRSALVHFASRAASVLRLLPQTSHARTPKDVGEKGTLSPCTPGSCGWLFGLQCHL